MFQYHRQLQSLHILIINITHTSHFFSDLQGATSISLYIANYVNYELRNKLALKNPKYTFNATAYFHVNEIWKCIHPVGVGQESRSFCSPPGLLHPLQIILDHIIPYNKDWNICNLTMGVWVRVCSQRRVNPFADYCILVSVFVDRDVVIDL